MFSFLFLLQMSPVLSVSFGADTESSQWLVSLILSKILSNLSALNSETTVVSKTLDLLMTLVDRKNRLISLCF